MTAPLCSHCGYAAHSEACFIGERGRVAIAPERGFHIPGRLRVINARTAGELLRLVLEHAPDVDAPALLDAPSEVWIWRWRGWKRPGEDTSIAAYADYVEAARQHLVDANELERSKLTRFAPADETHEAGFTAAIRLFWQGVCEGKAVEAEETAKDLQYNASECRRLSCKCDDSKQKQNYLLAADGDERDARECLAEAAQYRAWAGEA